MADHDNRARQYSISSGALHYLASLGAGFVVTVTALSMLVALNGSARYDVLKLQRQKSLLSDEIGEIQGRVVQMEESIDVLIEKDEKFRLLAGLDVIDEEIFQVGVGGPGMLTPESSPLWMEDPEAAAVTFATSYDILALERRAQLLSESLSEAMDSLQAHHDLLRSTPSISPTDGPITSGFSYARMHPIWDRELPHEGIDLHAPEGTPILATANGVVSYVGWRTGYGNTVEIDHGFGYMTRYAHALKFLVERGQTVTRGMAIAQVGQTGTATAEHVHYEIWVGGRAMDPQDYILNGVIP
ncbi:MAG: M23 family metallopeptidase [Gemmatimonadetes bacterium]|nr:M23 family metallopeptidase [Gemmatimonadota bacterium]